MKLTGETITDEQIRELLTVVTKTEEAAVCYCALGTDETDDSSAYRDIKRTRARARCAEIINARNGDNP